MAGGGTKHPYYTTDESTLDGATFKDRPRMPDSMTHGCLVSIDSRTLVALAGFGFKYGYKKAFQLNVDGSAWRTTLPDMRRSRMSAACVVVASRTGKRYILVSGGHNRQDSVSGSELYDLKAKKWIEGELKYS